MKKILVIDDDEFFRKFYSNKLSENGYEVITAADGEDGLEKIQIEKPDLILLDLIMPKKDGFGVLKAIAEKKITISSPIIIFSTLDQTKDIDEAKLLGASDYINKGVTDWDTTLAKISSHMKQ